MTSARKSHGTPASAALAVVSVAVVATSVISFMQRPIVIAGQGVEVHPVLTLAGLLFGLVAASFSGRAMWCEAASARALASTDLLTGVGNRHVLDDRVQPALFDRRFHHHAIRMIGLDLLDVHDEGGHATDAVLVGVADDLVTIGEAVTDGVARAVHYVVRLGRDEFLLSIHSPEPIDVHDLASRLDRMRSASIDVQGLDTIVEGVRIGSVDVEGMARIDDVLRAADLAVHQDGAAQRRDDTARRRSLVD